MPELPDLTVYVEALTSRLVGQKLLRFQVVNPFLLRTVEPTPEEFVGRGCLAVRRVGKQIAFGFTDDYWAVIHLMIAGRLRWVGPGKAPPRKSLALLETAAGSVILTEAGSNRRASLHLVAGSLGLQSRS